MKKILFVCLMVLFCGTVLNLKSFAKPDKVDGFNVPEGRIPQEIVDNRYPRT